MWIRVCILLLITGLASAQDEGQDTSKVNGAPSDANQRNFAPQTQVSPLTYQNTQPVTNPNIAASVGNLNQGNLVPQAQFNPLISQNIQPNSINPSPILLPQFNNFPGFLNPSNFQFGGLPDQGFGGFNPFLNFNNLQFNPTQNFAPQSFPSQIKEIRIPQPYPVYVNKPVPVQIPIRVPVEVPKPYPIRVPHPVPVPVEVRVPVPVEKPYPVQVTRTVPIPVERPVYIRVPGIGPQPYLQQNILPPIFQQFIDNPGQAFQPEVQIGGRIQSVSQQPEAREGVQPVDATTQNSVPSYTSSAEPPATPASNFINSNLNYNPSTKSTLLTDEVETGSADFYSSTPPVSIVKSNEIPTDIENAPR